jgi:hypothetical protein
MKPLAQRVHGEVATHSAREQLADIQQLNRKFEQATIKQHGRKHGSVSRDSRLEFLVQGG